MAKTKVVKSTAKKIKAPKTKTVRLNHTQKLMTVMLSGKVVTRDELNTLLGEEILMYRISTYMWAIKTKMNGVVKVIKEGRKVVAYQLLNPNEVINISKVKAVMQQPSIKAPSKVSKLKDLGAPESAKAETVEQDLEVTEITTAE